MKRINKQLFVAFLIFTFTVSPLSFSNISTLLQVDASQNIIGYQEWNQDVIIDSDVIVDAGATLVINKGVNVSFTQKWLNLYVYGTLIVKGTGSAPVTLSGVDMDNFAIITAPGSIVSINGANIVNGGYSAMLMKSATNTALASGYKGALQIDGGQVKVRNTTFKNSSNAVLVSTAEAVVQVHYSKFIDNSFDVEAPSNADFRFNWWGSSEGPQQTCYDYGDSQLCYFEKIYGDFNYTDWLSEENFHDPVIIIPGIFGSAEEDGQLRLDPVFHTYDNLYAEFANNGYVPDDDLFVFPYEWRDSNVENAKKLKDKIAEIKSATNWPRVDVVAHSMGGLLAREYIQSDYFNNDVDQLITMATPNLGAPEAYMKWEGDGWFLSPTDIYMNLVVSQEAKENGFADAFDYMHNRPIASLQELLPVYSYLYEADNGKNLRAYPDNYPRNEFLENLNANSSKLSLIEYDKIIGNIAGNNTVGSINVVNADMGKYWLHGYPLGFEMPGTDRGVIKLNGDGTVPVDSAKSVDIKSDNLIELPSDHRSIVTDAQKDVLELLTGTRPITEVKNSMIRNIFMAQVFSPIDIQIVAPDGKRVGKDFATGKILNEIEGAYYTGYETNSEYITIPNPVKGEYRILTQGTGDGAYTIETTEIDQDSSGVVASATNVIEGVASAGQQEEKAVEVKGVEFNTETKDVTAPEAKIFFNTQTNSIVVEGVDENPTTVTYATVAMSKKNQKQKSKTIVATITDQAGNVTSVTYTEKSMYQERRAWIELNSISYNGVVTKLHDAMAKYNWSLSKKGVAYSMFAANLRAASGAVESYYRPKQNVTIITSRSRDDQSVQKLSGMIVPALVTEIGVIKINY